MAGSLNHIVDSQGRFRGTELLDHLGDAYEALEECFDVIFYLSNGDKEVINQAMEKAGHHYLLRVDLKAAE